MVREVDDALSETVGILVISRKYHFVDATPFSLTSCSASHMKSATRQLTSQGASNPVDKEEQERQKQPIEVEDDRSGALERSPIESSGYSAPLHGKTWFWVELWYEKRELFKDAVAHLLLFAGLLGSLEVAHRLLATSTLPVEEINLLNKVHFYMSAIILVIFAFSFIIKVLKSEFGAKKN